MTEETPPACWLCDRPLGEVIELHLPVPKNRGGKAKVQVHPICHRTIHVHCSNSEMARSFNTPETLRGHAEIGKFVDWVAGKPADFDAATAKRK